MGKSQHFHSPRDDMVLFKKKINKQAVLLYKNTKEPAAMARTKAYTILYGSILAGAGASK